MSTRNDVAAAAMNGVELVASWLTPAVLFCVLNVMIGTIFFRSSLKPPQQRKDQRSQPRLVRVSSFLERVKAYNLSSYQSPQPDTAAREEEVARSNPEPAAREVEDPHHVARSKSDAMSNAMNLSNYQSPQSEPAAREKEVPHHVARSEPDSLANAFSFPSYQSSQPYPAAREVEDSHHVARSKSDAMSNAMNLSNYQSPQSEPAAREKEVPHHVARSEPDSVANAFSFPSYQSSQPYAAARETHHAPDAVANASNSASYQPEAAAREQEGPHHVARTKSEAVVRAAPAARALQKSASEKISMMREEEEEEEEDEERWRPATVRERTGGDEEVDEKADEFINNFRQQLKLQRVDSNLRYDEMLSRGAGR